MLPDGAKDGGDCVQVRRGWAEGGEDQPRAGAEREEGEALVFRDGGQGVAHLHPLQGVFEVEDASKLELLDGFRVKKGALSRPRKAL